MVTAITDKEGNHIWQSAIGDHSPTAPLRAVFYLSGIKFSLRGGKEHRDGENHPEQDWVHEYGGFEGI